MPCPGLEPQQVGADAEVRVLIAATAPRELRGGEQRVLAATLVEEPVDRYSPRGGAWGGRRGLELHRSTEAPREPETESGQDKRDAAADPPAPHGGHASSTQAGW